LWTRGWLDAHDPRMISPDDSTDAAPVCELIYGTDGASPGHTNAKLHNSWWPCQIISGMNDRSGT
jgi:hypothetical protein